MRKLCPRSFVLFVIDVILDATSLVTGEAAMIRLAAVNHGGGDDANIWRRPDPKKDFVLAVAFAVQRGCSNTLLRANSRRRNRRAAAVVEHENMNGSHIDA